MSTARPRVVVVGAGLTGLATAWRLRDTADVTLLEASDRFGGAVSTVRFDGTDLDVGADAFLVRQHDGVQLLEDAGFSGRDLVHPATATVLLWRGSRLRPLPPGTVMGVPTGILPLVRSRAVPVTGMLRAATEPLRPRRRPDADVSVAELLGGPFGPAVVEGLVEPLLGGVYAGRADRLSAEVAAAPVFAAARKKGSLLRALRSPTRGGGKDAAPVFVTLRGGIGRLVDRLATDLSDRARRGVEVVDLQRDGAGWRVGTRDAGSHGADHVVLAVPAGVAAGLLGPHAPEAAAQLAEFAYASVAVVVLAYDDDPEVVPHASGMLVPHDRGALVKAATFTTRKWPHHSRHPRALLRASVGRIDDDRHRHLTDGALIHAVDTEIRAATGIGGPLADARVVRWDRALPQYEVGHLDRVARVRAQVADRAPGVVLAGAAYDGIGLAARCRDAAGIAEELSRRPTRG